MNEQMTAAVLYGKEDVKIERVPIPELEKGEVLIRVQAALTCGTDLKVYRRGYHAKMIIPPALFGHEFAGVIEETGPFVKNFKTGLLPFGQDDTSIERGRFLNEDEGV